jgi:glycerol-3-phosphate dehydrogenase
VRRDLVALAEREFDLIVVGGGICGAATLWDAAQRGLRVALIERDDFGAATSAHSLKVVHGGIRYLQHLDFARVRESSRERSALLRIAPHLVQPLPVVVPTFGHGLGGRGALGAAFALLEAVTLGRNRRLADPERRIPRARLVSLRQLHEWYPCLGRLDLTGAGIFWDGQLLNPPRLIWEFVRTAATAGAMAANHCEVENFLLRGGRVAGVVVRDRLAGDRFEVRARVVVNAAGPYAEQLLVRGGLRPARGVPFSRDLALVIRRRPARHALALQTRYRDPDAVLSRGTRHLFLVPWRDVTLVGVNSAVFDGDPDRLAVTEAEVLGFLQEVNEAAPHLALTPDDVALVHAGLLPIQEGELVDGNVSFGKRSLVIDNAVADGTDGLITAITNRFTMGRRVAELAVDLAFRKLGKAPPRCRTEVTPLEGGRVDNVGKLGAEVERSAADLIPADIAQRLACNHGARYRQVLDVVRENPAWARPLGSSKVLQAEVIHAIREEMAHTLTDCVFQRTEVGTTGHPGREALEQTARVAAEELGWGAERTAMEVAAVMARFPGTSGRRPAPNPESVRQRR